VLDAATGASFADLGYHRRRAASIAGVAVDVSRTGYTGDLGYELWVEAADAAAVWDALIDAGRGHALRPAGLRALDLVRLEAGLILLGVDYTSSRHASIPEHAFSPDEIGLGRLVDFDKLSPFVGRRALTAELAGGGPARRLAGIELDWSGIEARAAAVGLAPAVPPTVSRTPVPVFAPDGPQIGRITSSGWSPIRKAFIALATLDAPWARPGGRVEVEWTVEARRSRVGGRVTGLPFVDLERRRALPAL
jgi:aminomethyltransferase